MIKNIIVFGGGGMVGSNLKLESENTDHNFLFPTRKEIDLLDSKKSKLYLETKNPDLIINLAGKVGGIKANMNDNFGFLKENLAINLNLIGSAKELGIKNFLNISSSCIYPKDQTNLLKESDILTSLLEPTNEGYAIAKITALKLCEYISNQFGFNYKTIIPCNLYGPFDKFNENAHMIPAVIKRVSEAKKASIDEIEMWGDGTARREFMYVGDFVEFLIFSISQFEKLPKIMNIGLGCDYTIEQYYNSIIKVIGFEGSVKKNLNQPIGMKKKQVDISKQTSLGWKPNHNLIQGIEKTYNYYQKL